MAYLAHLEKMGRELKCPICLSLLKSAVSLGCNHAFCNLCIMESMRSVSDCPVCKVPFCRREVRSAPHMDNLVAVFKSMEVAAGVYIFTTQAGPSTKNSGDVEKKSEPKEAALTPQGRSKKGLVKKKTQKSKKSDVSFPAKKRIHVTPFPVSETPVCPKKFPKPTYTNNEFENKKLLNEDKTIVEDKIEDTLFLPFFCLREVNDDENEEALTKPSDQPIIDTSPTNIAPCFSDIKDSEDDKSPVKTPPMSRFNVEETFDSEMFEWTQRPCSPELCSTPLKKQAEGRDKLDNIQEKDSMKQIGMTLNNELPHDVIVKCSKKDQANVQNQRNGSLPATKGCLKGKKRPARSREKHLKKYSEITYGCSLDEARDKDSCQKRKRIKSSKDNAVASKLDEVPADTINEAKTQNNHVYSSKLSENGETSRKSSPRSGQEIQKKSKAEPIQKRWKIHAPMDDNADEIKVASPTTDVRKITQSDRLAAKSLADYGNRISRKCANCQSKISCAFCQSSNDTKDSGEMMHYFKGKPIANDYTGGGNLIHSHKHCTEWAPDVYFEDDLVINLSAELVRSRRIKCSCCGIKGAALGCYEKSCRKSFHFTCAKLIQECRWDNDNFVMLCPLHASSKLPNESFESLKQRRKRPSTKGDLKASTASKSSHDTNLMWKWPCGSPCKWVLCCSALTPFEKDIINEFTRLTGVSITKNWTSTITHVIASTDENGACKRTLKFLLGILDGNWILSIEWIKACLKAKEPVAEENFEIAVDVHGISGGPRLGRLRVINKESKLFDKFRFYLFGDFIPSYKGYLQNLITAAGGMVLQRKPLTQDQEELFHKSSMLETCIIYSFELNEKQKSSNIVDISSRHADAKAIADACGAKVATSSWIIDSIAASKLQPLT